MTKSERIEELKSLLQKGIPEGVEPFSEWSHQVRTAIGDDDEGTRWDYLSAQYKNSDPTDEAARSHKLLMESLIKLVIQDLVDSSDPRKPVPPRFWIYLAGFVAWGFFRFALKTPPGSSPELHTTPAPTPASESTLTQTPVPFETSPTPKPSSKL
jgi:hypothetical protein